jgi:hypothetical protein
MLHPVFRRSLADLTRFRHVSYVTFAADRAVLPAVTVSICYNIGS